jgi:hypothetical protein
MEPVTDILYPVVDRIDKIQIITENETTVNDDESKVVAVISATFYWRDALKNVLPNNRKGLVVVIENPCTASFTYVVE